MEVEHPKKCTSKSRLGGFSSVYHEICGREFSKCLEIEQLLINEEDEIARCELEQQHFESGVKSIILADLGIKAAINDYGLGNFVITILIITYQI